MRYNRSGGGVVVAAENFWARPEPFLDRNDIRAELSDLLIRCRAAEQPLLAFVYGIVGIGRCSALWQFHREHEDELGPLLTVNAEQADGHPTPQLELYGNLLRQLDLLDNEQPESETARRDALRRLLAGRGATTLLVRNLVSAEQLQPLVADEPLPQVTVLATATTRLASLDRFNVADLHLDRLGEEHARRLLTDRLGAEAGELDQATLDELADHCGGVPLALVVLAATLRRSTRRAPRLLTELRRSAAVLLGMDRERRMIGFLDTAYRGLDTDSLDRVQLPGEVLRRAYRLLALLPGPSFTLDAAAVQLDVDRDRAEDLVEQLVTTNLVNFDKTSGRYVYVRLVRAHAHDLAYQVDGRQACEEAVARAVTWYLDEAASRDMAMSGRWRVGEVFERVARSARPDSELTAWFDAEWATLVDCVDAAAQAGCREVAWQLCVALFKYLHEHGHLNAWLRSHNTGTTVAEGNDAALMQLHSQRGAAHLAMGELLAARRDFAESRLAAERTEHRFAPIALQSAVEWEGKTYAAEGDVDRALACYARSEEMAGQAGAAIDAEQQVRVAALLNLQRARAELIAARWAKAAATIRSALDYFGPGSSEADNRAKCLIVLVEALLGAGQPVDAARAAVEAVAIVRQRKRGRPLLVQALRLHGRAAEAVGDRDSAVESYREALELLVALGDPAADEVRRRLIGLDQ